MEILLRVEDGRRDDPERPGSPDHIGDVAVHVEDSHTVGQLTEAVVASLGIDVDPGVAVSRDGSGPLDPRRTVADTGLVSGDVLVIGRTAHRDGPPVGGLRLVVASGPDAGRSIGLGPGRHLVGRDPACDLVLTDPQISRRHLAVTVGADGVIRIEALADGRNPIRVGGAPVEGDHRLLREEVVVAGTSTLVGRDGVRSPTTAGDGLGRIPFHRAPYFPTPVRPLVIEPMAEMPTRPDRSRFAWLAAVLPLLMGVSFALLLGNPRYLLFALFSPVMVVGHHFEQRRRSGRAFDESVTRFEAELADRAVEIRRALADERDRRFAAAPDVAALADRAVSRSADLWVRDRQADDFLVVRFGIGSVPATLEVRRSDRGDPEYRDRVDEVCGETDVLADVPVTLDLATLGVVGLVGASVDTTAAAASVTLQAACLHSPEDLVVIAGVAPERGLDRWLKWLPHTRAAASPLSGAHLATAANEVDMLLGDLVTEAGRRLRSRPPEGHPWLLVLLDRALAPDPALVSRLLDACPEAGIAVLWLADAGGLVPRQTRVVIDCRSPRSSRPSRVVPTDPDIRRQTIDLDRVGSDLAETTARALAPLRDASSANAATALPRTVPLFAALGVEAIDAAHVAQRWRADRGYSLRTTVGHSELGRLTLDLVDHGPHALIGGTSGSGKSELLMSLVAGLIADNPPTRVNFLFIDYKGGASSDLFRTVPHTVGYVTNLDRMTAMRALTSLRAELNRRMGLLQGRAKDLAEMLARHPDEAPPSLVIVVDEFATLVREIPEFVDGMVDVAQRGRSLGIHLILATQRPSGSVNDNITANTNLRIALRVLDGAESTSVVGSPDAASIPTPLRGRGFVRLGAGELVAFQSAWSGAPLLAEAGLPPVGVRLFGRAEVAAAGISTPAAAVEPEPTGRTQVDALIDAVVEAARRGDMPPGRPPWLEVLPPEIILDEVRAGLEPAPAVGFRIGIGMIDDPEAQSQYPAVIDLARTGGLVVAGTGGSGKSTVLATAARFASLDDAERGGGGLTIFAIDAASRDLVGLEQLRQCGAVATVDDLEAVTRVIDLLDRELERRRLVLAEAVARSAPPEAQAAVLLLIDGLDALTRVLDQGPAATGLLPYTARLVRLLTEGRQVGIHPVVATARWSALPAAVASAISSRLTLRQSDALGYGEGGIPAAQARELDLRPGQGFLNGTRLVQVAIAEGPIDSGSSSGRVDPRLVTARLPRRVPLLSSGVPRPLRPVVGLTDLTGEPYGLDLNHANLSVVGDPRSGRSTVLATIGCQAARAGAEVWVVAGLGSPLADLDEVALRCVAEGPERVAFLEELAERAVRPATTPRLLLLDDHDQLPDADRVLIASLERVLGAVRWVAAGSRPRGFSGHPVAQLVRTARSMVHLRPHDPREAHELLGVAPPWHPGLPMVEGRGLVAVDRVVTMIQFSDPFIPPGR